MSTLGSKHVPELDGLRGIAILSVIVHHRLTPFSLHGGFLGVDLFFVLSGFLITSLLLGEFRNTATISLRNFYMRRLLRLGPALLIYLCASLLVTWHSQLIDIKRQLKLIAYAVFYSTNWRMAFRWDDVLDPTAIIWSLSIEEQFYLIWPLILFGCLAFKVRPRYIIGGLILIVTAIAINRWLLLAGGSDLTRLYYGSDTRADALLVGCLFAFLNVRPPQWSLGNGFKVLALGCTICLGVWMATADFSNLSLYRGGFTVFALVAGVVIFNAANSPARVVSMVLGWRPLRWFGEISYGLYLWHWLVVRNASLYFLGRWEPWSKLALALGIAAASFYLIEKPINKLKTRFSMKPAPSLTAPITITPAPLPVEP